MAQIKIFHKYLEAAGNGSFEKIQEKVNAWLTENPKIEIKNIFSANMPDNDGDGHFILIVVWEEELNTFGLK